jgi:hypothetical protein
VKADVDLRRTMGMDDSDGQSKTDLKTGKSRRFEPWMLKRYAL